MKLQQCMSECAMAFSVIAIAMSCASGIAEMGTDSLPHFKVGRFVSASEIELIDDQAHDSLKRGARHGVWTFMGATSRPQRYAILEDFHVQDGHILFVDADGVKIDLPKTAESNIKNAVRLFLGHTSGEVSASKRDLLGEAILSHAGDPEYAEIEGILPKAGVKPPEEGELTKYPTLEAFIGTPDTSDKLYFVGGGWTPNFFPFQFHPSIDKSSREGTFLQGLVGGYLPAVRYVYPDVDGAWTEVVAFAPFRMVDGNNQSQPAWYRVSRIENGVLRWCDYTDSYQPGVLPEMQNRGIDDGHAFYADFLLFRDRWNEILNAGMKVNLPDKRIENMARFSLVASIMTRAGDFPRYGIPNEGGIAGYGASEHNGFPDTFTDQADTMLEWGSLDLAGRYIDNYLAYFVREDGSILYYGPETGQYGRMLAIFAKYLDEGGDPQVLVGNKAKVEGIVRLLLKLRTDALKLPKEDPAYGMLAGKSEADTFADPRFVRPFFSNSAEAVRGFHDFGAAWQALGARKGDAEMSALGGRLVSEAASLQNDLTQSLMRSTLTIGEEKIIPTIAGAKVPSDVALEQDETDPEGDYYRSYMEMMHSGALSIEQSEALRQYLMQHRGLVLGLPSIFIKGRYTSFGFLSSGYGYSLIQTDHIREALLNLYSTMANSYTRGTWLTPEERDPLVPGWERPPYGYARYSVSAEVTIADIVRWLLVFEDPASKTLWLGKGIPEKWLEDGKTVAVADARTQWGQVGFSIVSHAKSGTIEALVKTPRAGIPAPIKLRLRTGPEFHMKSVTLNGKPWTQFDANEQVVVIPASTGGALNIVARD